MQVNAKHDVVFAIPRSGRTFENFLNKIKALGGSASDIDKLIEVVSKGKKHKTVSLQEALAYYAKIPQETFATGLFIDRKRETRPFRLGFLSGDLCIDDIHIRLEGDEPHNCSSLVSLGEADIAIAGLDELLTVTQSHLKEPYKVTKWGMYNYNLPKEKKLRVAGSAMLTRWNSLLKQEIQDIVGFFLISRQKPSSKNNYKYPEDHLQHLQEYGNKVFVKGRYADMIRAAYPALNIEAVHDVEDAVSESQLGAVGLEIVQSGSTLKRKGLVILGSPLFISESLYVVDYYKYLGKDNEKLRNIMKKIKPAGYFDSARLKQFALWFVALEKNIGDNWLNKPDIVELFCTDAEPYHGLRPARLKTRYWSPNDSYKVEEAYQYVQERKRDLVRIYRELRHDFNV